jgi:hypothetical protein
MTVFDELERLWKEAVIACFKLLSQNLPEVTEEDYEIPQSG